MAGDIDNLLKAACDICSADGRCSTCPTYDPCGLADEIHDALRGERSAAWSRGIRAKNRGRALRDMRTRAMAAEAELAALWERVRTGACCHKCGQAVLDPACIFCGAPHTPPEPQGGE